MKTVTLVISVMFFTSACFQPSTLTVSKKTEIQTPENTPDRIPAVSLPKPANTPSSGPNLEPIPASTPPPPPPPASIPSRVLISGKPILIGKQDFLYSFAPQLLDSKLLFFSNNLPPWARFDLETGKIEGIPNNPGLFERIAVFATKNGIAEILGPFSIHVLGDPLKTEAWHLKNIGQKAFSNISGVPGVDLHMDKTIAEGISGAGIKIAVSDTGIEIKHEDLADNIIPGVSKNYNLPSPWMGDPTPKSCSGGSFHGTAVSGIIAATGWNGIGSRGVAPGAHIAGFLFLSLDDGRIQDTSMLQNQAEGDFDVFNYSYGTPQCIVSDMDPFYLKQLEFGVSHLRSGKGAIYVKAAGNDFRKNLGACNPFLNGIAYYGNSNFDPINSYPQMISAAAIDSSGKITQYSSPGSNVWISAPAGHGYNGDPAIVTTDLSGCDCGLSKSTATTPFERGESLLNPNCNYTSRMNGTSSAAPITAGVAALALSVNPNMSWRDMKYILAKTARRIQPDSGATGHPDGLDLESYTYQEGWTKNAAEVYFHNQYGFGLIDTDAAVAMAKNYAYPLGSYVQTKDLNRVDLQDSERWIYGSGELSLEIPDKDADGVMSSIKVRHNLEIETIEIVADVTHDDAGTLGIELYSPSGTKSILMNINSSIAQVNLDHAHFLANAFLNEMSAGTWTLKVIDGSDDFGEKIIGKLTHWQVNINGHIPAKRLDMDPPVAVESVKDGESCNSLTHSPLISWIPTSSSDLLRYEYSIGSAPKLTDVLKWKSSGIETTAVETDLNLKLDKKYYINVRVIDTSENVSLITTSDGWSTNSADVALCE